MEVFFILYISLLLQFHKKQIRFSHDWCLYIYILWIPYGWSSPEALRKKKIVRLHMDRKSIYSVPCIFVIQLPQVLLKCSYLRERFQASKFVSLSVTLTSNADVHKIASRLLVQFLMSVCIPPIEGVVTFSWGLYSALSVDGTSERLSSCREGAKILNDATVSYDLVTGLVRPDSRLMWQHLSLRQDATGPQLL